MTDARKAISEASAAIILPVMVLILILMLAAPAAAAASDDYRQALKTGLLELASVKDDMNRSGAGTLRVSDLITEGFFYLDRNDLENVEKRISEVHELRNLSETAKAGLIACERLLKDINDSNSLTQNQDETIKPSSYTLLKIESAKKEFSKENYEEAAQIIESARKEIILTIKAKFIYLNESIISIGTKIDSLGLSRSRLVFLEDSLAMRLEKGDIAGIKTMAVELGYLNSTIMLYQEVNDLIPGLLERNISAKRISDGLADAESEINMASYESSARRLEGLKKTASKALLISDKAKQLESQLNALVSHYSSLATDEKYIETSGIIGKASSELMRGNYDEAESSINSAQADLESLKAKLLIAEAQNEKKQTLQEYLRASWKYLLLAAIVSLIIIKLTHRSISAHMRKHRLKRLELELAACKSQVGELQTKYFIRKKISRQMYDEAYESLQRRIVRLNENISLMHKKTQQAGVKQKH
ncbi:MAG: hypothetical protein V1866_00675 [archaeon]